MRNEEQPAGSITSGCSRRPRATTLGAQVLGSVRVHDVSGDTSEFGMLVAAAEHRSTGVGRALVEDAYPHLAPLLATPCDLDIHGKPLR